MNRKILVLLVSALSLLLVLAACSGGNPGTPLTGAERDTVLAYAQPIQDNLLQGLKDNNYEQFSKDFNETMLKAMDKTKFDALVKQLDDKIGQYQSSTVDQVVDYGKMVTVVSKGVFNKSSNVQILVTVDKAEPHKVSGLYFR